MKTINIRIKGISYHIALYLYRKSKRLLSDLVDIHKKFIDNVTHYERKITALNKEIVSLRNVNLNSRMKRRNWHWFKLNNKYK